MRKASWTWCGSAALSIVLAIGAAGCDGGGAAVPDGGSQAADGGADAGPSLDPRLFDCTSLGPDGTTRPERKSTLPPACVLDPACRKVRISGHRGVGGDPLGAIAPEDTLAAYRAAIALGIDMVETDPRPTADGVLINLHDTTVDRTTDGRGQASALTFAQIRALKIKADRFAGDYSCERVPTLVEILKLCKGRIHVNVDANKTDRVDLLVGAIKEADALDWAIFNTSSLDKIDAALKLEPKLHIMIRPSSLAEIEPQMDHFAPRVPVIVELEPSDVKDGSAVVRRRGSISLTDTFAEDAAAGLQGNLSGYGKVVDSGLDFIQSDRPDLALRLLIQRGLR